MTSRCINCPSIRKARDDGVRHTEDVVAITEHVGYMRTHRFQTQERAVLSGDQMKELRSGGEVVNDVVVEGCSEFEGVVGLPGGLVVGLTEPVYAEAK